jgi:hypothetical protein
MLPDHGTYHRKYNMWDLGIQHAKNEIPMCSDDIGYITAYKYQLSKQNGTLTVDDIKE